MTEKRNSENIGPPAWRAPDPKAVFLLVHGLGTYAGRWEAAAEFFLKRGISSYAVELKFAEVSVGNEGAREDFEAYYNRILSLRDMAVKENPGKKIFIVGESMGALIAFLLSAARPGLFNGLVCISPAFSTKNKLSFADCVRMMLPLLYDPQKKFTLPFDSSMCTRDPYYINKLDNDPREYRTISSAMIFRVLSAQLRAAAIKKKMTTPTLFLIAGEDKIADSEKSKIIFKDLVVKDKELVEFSGMYHSLSVDLGKEVVFEKILTWVEKRITL